MRRRTIVITGATSGLGAEALPHLAEAGYELIVGTRGVEPAVGRREQLDLESLASVRDVAARVLAHVGDRGIDILVLNAGAKFPDTDTATAEGFERTFAVNHLAHFVLVELLAPAIARGGRIVLTTSDTHDPERFPFGPSELAVRTWARTGSGASPIQAYAAAKLGNLLTAQHLAAQPELLARDVTVIAYNPGLTGGTGLQRALPEVRAQVEAMRKRSEQQGGGGAHHHVGTPERAGQALAELALGTVPDGVVYASLDRDEITFPAPSELARRSGSALELWRETRNLLAAN